MAKLYKDFLNDLSKVSENDRPGFLRAFLRPKKNLHLFGRYFFPHIIKGNYETPEAHLSLIVEISKPLDSAIIFPRGFAKSTWVKIDTIHDIVYATEPVMLYIGNTLQDAKFHFESIKTELENNEVLIQVYGNLVPDASNLGRKWTNNHFETTNGVNMVARGAGKGRGVNIKNQRPTKIIMDDIEDDEQVASPDRRLKLHNWINNVILNSRDKVRGKLKFIGTVISPMAEVLKFYKGHGGIFRKAIENGKSIWPEYFSLEDLYRIRDGYTNAKGEFIEGIGTRSFSQELLNTPINEELARIKPEWLEKSMYSTLDEAPHAFRTIIMMDPQAGEKKGSDYYGICVLGYYEKDRHRYIMKIKTGKDTQLGQAAELIRTWLEYPKSRLVGVEKVLGQVAVYQNILEWKAGVKVFDEEKFPDLVGIDRNMPFKGMQPRGKDGKVLKDKVTRLQMHEASIERGEVHLHQSMSAFAEKLVAFPDVEHDDDVDAFIYCLDESYQSGLSSEGKTSNNSNRTNTTIVGNIMQETF